MFADEMRRAVEAAPRMQLAELSAAVWKGFAAGALAEDEAQQLAELIQVRKGIPLQDHQGMPSKRRRVGSRPRSGESMERRRRWTASGWLPPQLAARFTMAECAALATIAAEVARCGQCTMPLDKIAALAGVGRTTVRNALAEARKLGLLTVELRPRRAFRSDTNVVRIVASAWQSWVSMRRSSSGQGGGRKTATPTKYMKIHSRKEIESERVGGSGAASERPAGLTERDRRFFGPTISPMTENAVHGRPMRSVR